MNRSALSRAWLGGLLLVCVPGGLTSAGEVEVAARMTQDCAALLNQLLGHGKAKVFIQVQGEQAEVRTQTEFLTPIRSTGSPAALPGFAVSRYLDRTYDLFQRDQEQSTRMSSFRVQRIDASLVLDESLSTEQVNAVRRILSDLLRLDMSRGDNLVVLRASLAPAWKEAVLSPDGVRDLVRLAALGAVLVFVVLVGYLLSLRAFRLLAEALAQRRDAAGWTPGLPAAPAPALAAAPGGVQAFAEPGIPPMGGAEPWEVQPGFPAGENLLLGQRFQFIESKKPEELAEVLRAEPPEDLALFFGHLAGANPTQASLVFSALPRPLQVQVSQALAGMEQADPGRLSALEERLRSQVELSVRGTDRLGTIFSRLPLEERNALMGELSSVDPGASEKVSKGLVAFEDLLDLKTEDLRRLLAGVPYLEWAAALKGLAPGLAGKALEQFPPGTRELLQEAMEGPQPKAKALEVRSRILTKAQALAAEGRIELRGGPKP